MPSSRADNFGEIELQVRQRLWFSIGVLDHTVSIERNAKPLMTPSDLSSAPMIIDDISVLDWTIVHNGMDSATDMAFSYVLHRTTTCAKKLIMTLSNLTEPQRDWEERQTLFKDYEHAMREHIQRIRNPRDTFMGFIEGFAEDSILDMRLLLARPSATDASRPTAWATEYHVLAGALEIVLRYIARLDDPDSTARHWFVKSNLKLHALKVILVELLTKSYGQLEYPAYSIALIIYKRYHELLPYSDETEQVWKPINELMRKLRLSREKAPERVQDAAEQRFDLRTQDDRQLTESVRAELDRHILWMPFPYPKRGTDENVDIR